MRLDIEITYNEVTNMARKTGGISTYYKDPKASGDKSQSNDRTKSKSKSKFFRNFWRTKTKAYMLTYDDTQQISVLMNTLSSLNAGDPHTAFLAFLDGWQIGAKTGNMKEVDATELAAWKEWVLNWLTVAWDVMAQLCLRPFLAGVTESSITATSATTIAIWNQSDWDNFLSSLEKHNCPDFIYRFLKPFMYYIKMTESYMKAELPVPPSYLLLNVHTHTLIQLEAHRELFKTNAGYAETHCQKYGIPFSKFSADKLKCVEVKRNDIFNNQDLIAYFNIMPIVYTIDTPAVTNKFHAAILTGANLTTDYSLINYVFDDQQEMSILHALFPIWGTTIVNNTYGEMMTTIDSGAAEYDVNVLHMKLLGTSWTQGTIASCRFASKLLFAYWAIDATRHLLWGGTDVTVDQTPGLPGYIAFEENLNICYDTGHVVGAEVLDACFNAAKYMIYGE